MDKIAELINNLLPAAQRGLAHARTPSESVEFKEAISAAKNWNQQDRMSLRDYFAAKTMTGIASTDQSTEFGKDRDYWYDAALRSYTAADAMLAARTGSEAGERVRQSATFWHWSQVWR